MVLCWLDLLCQRTSFPVFCQGLIGRENKSAQSQTKRCARVQISDLATRAMQQRSKSPIWVTPLLIAEKQEQNRKNSISSISSSDFRSSPKKYFFGLSSANVFQILRSMSAKPKTNYRCGGVQILHLETTPMQGTPKKRRE